MGLCVKYVGELPQNNGLGPILTDKFKSLKNLLTLGPF